MSDQEEAELLFKLYRKGIWGGRHTPLKNLYRIVPIAFKKAEKAAKKLNNQEWITFKKSTNEIHVSLNSHYKKEIRDFIIEVLNIDKELLK